ncbi:MAG: DUF1343 domain-containing protein [Bacteroidetes bacterium]|jgi:uncharacterized protein YbbC (DUF1343 family)|nr:DUF1343 domain-containing protein [Bacteroidota bacterium]
MLSKVHVIILPVISVIIWSCAQSQSLQNNQEKLLTGAEQTNLYLPDIENKKVGVVVNHTSFISGTHLIDSLISLDIHIQYIFTPEHGFKGTADAGEKITDDGHEETNNIPIISLYGNSYKPDTGILKELDVVLFDLQDVGVRYYTYISTMHYVMEACAEAGVKCIVLDRPNPNAFYIDGPVLDMEYQSFVGMHPVPVVYGMTIGEYAQMINGERWLKNAVQCDLTVIPCKNYSHDVKVELKINPSPNLTSMRSIYLYPSLGFFEGTIMSVGRGTEFPFEVYGHPAYPDKGFSFIPTPVPGAAKNPKYKNRICYGVDLRKTNTLYNNSQLELDYLMDAFQKVGGSVEFFNNYFNLLAGTDQLKEQILDGWQAQKIRSSWQEDLIAFKAVREKYLLYPDVY